MSPVCMESQPWALYGPCGLRNGKHAGTVYHGTCLRTRQCAPIEYRPLRLDGVKRLMHTRACAGFCLPGCQSSCGLYRPSCGVSSSRCTLALPQHIMVSPTKCCLITRQASFRVIQPSVGVSIKTQGAHLPECPATSIETACPLD